MRVPPADVSEPGYSSDIFCHIGRILTSSLNTDDVLQRVMKIIGEYFSPRNWSLLLKEENSGRLKFELVRGVDANRLKDIFLDRDEGVVGWVCRNGKPLVVEDAPRDPRFSSRVDRILGFKTRSVVCVPLLNGANRVIGAIELINCFEPPAAGSPSDPAAGRQKTIFTAEDLQLLSAIASFAGIALENASLHQQVKALAVMDSLTKIYNRHYFNEVLQCEIERVRRYKLAICLLMIDVDEFKKINDTFGHLIGDRVLYTVAKILKASVRESDILARFGGDEFVIIMPFAGSSQGLVVAERIKQGIRQQNWQKLIPGYDPGLSIGVHAAGPENVDSLLLEADRALYRDKRGGQRRDKH